MQCTFRYSTRLSLWTLLIGSFNIAGLRPGPSVWAESLDAVNLSAVSGGDTTLPCDTYSPQPPDALLLVVWYKNDIPIYSYDGRVKGPSAHWADATLVGRARWHLSPHSVLRIRNIVPSDRALYRCRVDFKVSPTRNYKYMLHVIELPEKPKIFDEKDKEVIGTAGPYVEDSSLKLTCSVSIGRPMPRIRWWKEDKVIAKLDPVEDETRLSLLELRIPSLKRDHFEAVYSCTADNNAIVPPLRVNVQIQLYLRPLSVEILEREQPLSVGQETDIACKAVGARPPATITWWLGDKKMVVNTPQTNSEDRNETISFLRWTPRMENDGGVLTCRASHPKLEHATLETTMTLDLHYVPIVELQLGSKLNPNDIEEGDDVYFECIVRANPPSYKVVWEHNGQVMTHNQRAGVIAGSAHLALQGVSRDQAGQYVCVASNVEGDGRSLPVSLQVIYKPICKNTVTAIVGAAINEAARVACEVDAFPLPKNFQWTLNNTLGTTELDAGKFTIEKSGRSILTYIPTSDMDYGSLACRATNLAGQQIEPCRYTLLPAVKPDPPGNCSTLNLTDDSAEIKCVAGYDGGLQTTYFVEAWEADELIANVSTILPVWKLQGLGSGKALQLVFYASNARGRSEITTLRIHTLSRLALHTEAKNNYMIIDTNWALGIVAGALGTLAAVAVIAVLARRRQRPMEYDVPLQTMKASKGAMHSSNNSPIQDDKNPDVVPLGKDFNCTRDSELPPEPPPYGIALSNIQPVGASKSAHSLHDRANTPHTLNTPGSDGQSISTLTEDRRSLTSGTLSRRREVVTTRTTLLTNARESCV
nr:hemicentin-2-like [Danaus plexippus plexippus]